VKVFLKVSAKIFGTLLSIVLVFGVVSHILLKHYTGLSVFEGISMFLDLTRADSRQKTWGGSDRQAIFDEINRTMYLKDGTITQETFDKMLEILQGQQVETAMSKTLQDNFDDKSDCENALKVKPRQVANTQQLIEYIFENVFGTDKVDIDRLANFDYHLSNVYKTTLTDKMLAAFLDSTISSLAQNKIFGISDIDNITVVDVAIDKSLYKVDYQDTMVTRAYASVAVDKSDVIDAIVNASGSSGFKKDLLYSTLNTFMPKTFYFETLIGLSHSIPVQIGVNNLRIGNQYQKLTQALSQLSATTGLSIDLDQLVSTPINNVVVTAMQSMKPYIDITEFDNGRIQIDLLGALLGLSGVNDTTQSQNPIESRQLVLAIKAVYYKTQDKLPKNWFYEIDTEGNYIIKDGSPIVYKSFDEQSVQEYKVQLAKKISLQYRLSLRGKINEDGSFVEYKYKIDYNKDDGVQQFDKFEDVDFVKVFDYLIAFLLNKEEGNDEYYSKQFDITQLAKRFEDEVVDINITSPDEILEFVKDKLALKLNGADLFAIAFDQFDQVFENIQVQEYQISLQSIAVKNIFTDVKHTTLFFGIKISIPPVQGDGEFINNFIKDIQLGIELDITPNLTDAQRLGIFISVNHLNNQESKVLFEFFSNFGVGVGPQTFSPLVDNLDSVFEKMVVIKYMTLLFEAEKV